MIKQIEKRLLELKAEHDKGQKYLEELNTEINKIKVNLIRISGAIQALEELKKSEKGNDKK